MKAIQETWNKISPLYVTPYYTNKHTCRWLKGHHQVHRFGASLQFTWFPPNKSISSLVKLYHGEASLHAVPDSSIFTMLLMYFKKAAVHVFH
jgi:hypothetical protein